MDLMADQVYALARTLGALLPWRTLGHPRVAPRQAQRELLMDRREAACYAAGLHALDAVVIADALGSALCGGAGRFEPLAAEVARATAVLHLAAGGAGEGARPDVGPPGARRSRTVPIVSHALRNTAASLAARDTANMQRMRRPYAPD